MKTNLIPSLSNSDKERFWGKADKRGPDECWEWNAAKDNAGYGWFYLCGKMYRAHRISWVVENGSIPEGKLILHKCDNPPCVNPGHFFIGVQKDNVLDMERKSRASHPSGAFHGSRTHPEKLSLTDLKVLEIRKCYSEGESQVKIAGRFGISQSQVSRTINRRNWAHI